MKFNISERRKGEMENGGMGEWGNWRKGEREKGRTGEWENGRTGKGVIEVCGGVEDYLRNKGKGGKLSNKSTL